MPGEHERTRAAVGPRPPVRSTAARICGWNSSTAAGPATSTGTTFSNAPGGVTSSSAAPSAPPSAVSTAKRRTVGHWPVSSGREPAAAPTDVTVSATVLVTFAATAGSPAASRAG